jgi:hypothetical protein
MGNIISYNIVERNICNYDCKVCRDSGNLPNILGRFYIINEKECICNGCNTIYKKEGIYT